MIHLNILILATFKCLVHVWRKMEELQEQLQEDLQEELQEDLQEELWHHLVAPTNSQLKKSQRLTHRVGAKMFKRPTSDDGKQMDPILKKF